MSNWRTSLLPSEQDAVRDLVAAAQNADGGAPVGSRSCGNSTGAAPSTYLSPMIRVGSRISQLARGREGPIRLRNLWCIRSLGGAVWDRNWFVPLLSTSMAESGSGPTEPLPAARALAGRLGAEACP